ncbi:MAG: mechanosensitive ion channel family protein [Bacteroidota bacterium]|nr:mechanosensitive ion channel family protein [Bacteroidota bacterium]
MNDFLNLTYFSNTILDYIISICFIIFGIVFICAFRRIVLNRIKGWTANTSNNYDDFIIENIDRFGVPALYFGVIYVGLSYLTFSERVDRLLHIATTIAITVLVIRFLSSVFLLVLQSFIRKQPMGEEKVKQLGGLMILVNIVIWVIGIVFLFDNMGYDVTAVIAGLGIGGIAIALAAQNILGDLFNYFVIFLDRPFEIGDFIIIDEKKGVVEHIGIKTTRLKSLTGEQLVVANSDLTGSRIHNYKRMENRRAIFNINVEYQTSFEKIKTIPDLLKSIVMEQELAIFDRSHFLTYEDSSLNFEVVYFVKDSKYTVFADVQQAINMRIFEEFNKRGIVFAFPTRTLHIANQQNEESPDKRIEFLKNDSNPGNLHIS